jgi:methylated-DNA-[protein]-cysteine S-methyltransferase
VKAQYAKWKSPLGYLHLLASDQALLSLAFDRNLPAILKRLAVGEMIEGDNPIIRQAKAELSEYFEGRRRFFEVALEPRGTEFQKRVWAGLLRIPYGERISYRDQARTLDYASAVRAVGSANGRNPLAIIIPCHRVVRSDSTLGGYAGGLEIKERLLALESGHVLSESGHQQQ